jgi:hypothetical protein
MWLREIHGTQICIHVDIMRESGRNSLDLHINTYRRIVVYPSFFSTLMLHVTDFESIRLIKYLILYVLYDLYMLLSVLRI